MALAISCHDEFWVPITATITWQRVACILHVHHYPRGRGSTFLHHVGMPPVRLRRTRLGPHHRHTKPHNIVLVFPSPFVNVSFCRNGSWADGPHEAVNSGWGDDAKTGVGGVSSWNEQPLNPTSWAGSKPKNSINPGWVDGDLEASSWGHAPKQVSMCHGVTHVHR